MLLFAIMMSSLAAITGILAVGSGAHWDFRIRDYFRGKRNAILYLWVTFSTIFSICHAGMLISFYNRTGVNASVQTVTQWMALHATIGILLVTAHIFVALTLAREVRGPHDRLLWGKGRNAAS